MKKPYCIVNNIKYPLDDELRFPDLIEMPDLNELWIDYSYNKITLHDVFVIYSSIGVTYDLVFNYFSKYGCYGSVRKSGDFLNFELFTDDDKTNKYYNDTKEDDLKKDIENILTDILEENFDKNNIIIKLEKCIELLKQ